MARTGRRAVLRGHLHRHVTPRRTAFLGLALTFPVAFLVLGSGGASSPRARIDAASEALTTSTVRAESSTTAPATTTTVPKVEVAGEVVVRTSPPTDPPPTDPPSTELPPPPEPPPPPPPPPRSYLYGPNAGFPRGATITVSSTIDAPGLGAAAGYWNQLAGRTLFAVGAGSAQVNVRAGEGICSGGSVACAAPASAIDHIWHPDMTYPYEHCDVYVLAAWVGDWSVIAHEMGHCLGFDHGVDWLSIMTSPPHPDPELDRNLLVGAGYIG